MTAHEKNIWIIPTSRNPNQISAALWWIFSSNTCAPSNWKKRFYTSRLPKNKEIGGIFVQYLVANNFELFSEIQDQNKKNEKPIAVDVHLD